MIDRKLINLDQLLDDMLDTQHGNRNQWVTRVEIIPEYMPQFPRPDTRPTCVAAYVHPDGRRSFLRYSKGPYQGYFWDVYGEDMLRPELALLAVMRAPVPPGAQDKSVWEPVKAKEGAEAHV